MRKKQAYYISAPLLQHFEKTTLENLDFEEFFHKYPPTKDDVVFLDQKYLVSCMNRNDKKAEHLIILNY